MMEDEGVKETLRDWEYRAEGNFHIVIANRTTRQVIRLPKCFKDQKKKEDISSLEAATSELSFVRHVAHPAMRNCKACYPVKQVLLSREFLKKISRKVEPFRPPARLHKVINDECKYGILMPDFCQVLPPPPNAVGAAITVEIKPKQGFLLKGHKSCKFSQFQRLKVKDQTYEQESTYCPIDLFSGCRRRMQRAIKSLIQNPQNNLRVFTNGEVIYSQENVGGTNREETEEIFQSNVLSLLIPHLEDEGSSAAEKLELAYVNFQDILCNLLLYPVCEKKPNITHTPQRCGRGCQERNNDYRSGKERIKTPQESLSPDCILGLLLYLQKLENRSISEYYRMYNWMKKHLSARPDDAERLSLSGPYDADHWQEVVTEICENSILTQISEVEENETSWKEDMDQVAYVLRKFLIATSFKDCSIMMTFQKKMAHAEGILDDLPLVIKTPDGLEYWASIALVDSDPKPASRIPEYFCNASRH